MNQDDRIPHSTLGDYLRQARQERGWSPDALAAPEFTERYILAIEQGRLRPSLQALTLLARRLDMPLSKLVTRLPAPPAAPDLGALEEDLSYQLDYLKGLITTRQNDEALQLLNSTLQEYEPALNHFRPDTRYRFYRLRGLAAVRVGAPARARPDLEQALTLAQQLGDPQEVERARNAVGAALYAQNLPRQALEHHRQGLHAVHTGLVRDRTLRLSIYRNLANAYWALNELAQAIATYREALPWLADLNDPARHAEIYKGLSLAYKDADDLPRAQLYAAQALDMYQAAHNPAAVAQMQVNLAEILAARRDWAAASELLDAARQYQTEAGDPFLLSVVAEHAALVELGRGHVAQAAHHAARALVLTTEERIGTAGDTPAQARANATRMRARALHAAGLVAERQGQARQADTCLQDALALVAQTEYTETAHAIAFSYAELLTARGDHQQAALYYRAAARPATG